MTTHTGRRLSLKLLFSFFRPIVSLLRWDFLPEKLATLFLMVVRKEDMVLEEAVG